MTLVDPVVCASSIADAIWMCSSSEPIRPSILGYLDKTHFDIYDTTQGLQRDSRIGFQRGRIIASGIITLGAYVLGSAPIITTYRIAKTLEKKYDIAPGSLPCRVVLVGFGGCTLAGLRVLVKRAGVEIKARHTPVSERVPAMPTAEYIKTFAPTLESIPDIEPTVNNLDDNSNSNSNKRPRPVLQNDNDSFLSEYVMNGRRFIQSLRATASVIPSLSRVSADINARICAVTAGIERARLITGPPELLLISESFMSSSILQMKSLQEAAQNMSMKIKNAETAHNILVGLDDSSTRVTS